jgi:hypothetical protein
MSIESRQKPAIIEAKSGKRISPFLVPKSITPEESTSLAGLAKHFFSRIEKPEKSSPFSALGIIVRLLYMKMPLSVRIFSSFVVPVPGMEVSVTIYFIDIKGSSAETKSKKLFQPNGAALL